MPDLSRRLVAEFIGVFALCFIGIFAMQHGDLVSVAFAHGLTIAVMVAALGAISGAHFNPAVTVSFFMTGRMRSLVALLYIAAQLLGGLVAALLIAAVFDPAAVAHGTPTLAGGVGFAQALVLEIVATFILVLVIYGTAVDKRAPKYVFPLAIGLAVTLDILAIGPITGACMNPARAFGPALVGHAWDGQAVYWLGPMLGAALAAGLQHYFLLPGGLPQARD